MAYPLKGPALFYVDSDGTRFKGDLFSVGSGSTFAYGVLDQEYRWDLTDEEAQELARRSIYAASHRDAFSGNTCNLYHVKEEGWQFIGVYRMSSTLSCTNPCSQVTTTSLSCITMDLERFLVMVTDTMFVSRVILLQLQDKRDVYCSNVMCFQELLRGGVGKYFKRLAEGSYERRGFLCADHETLLY